jgi:hypothetical protein
MTELERMWMEPAVANFEALSRHYSVDVLMGYGLNGRSSIPGMGKFFLFSIASRLALGHTLAFHPITQWVPGAISSGTELPRRKADHSHPSSAEVKNGGAIPPLTHMFSWNRA